MKQYFPLVIATGSQFCNRKKERDLLLMRIKNNTHTWISAPRRFGKSSLACQVFEDGKKLKSLNLHHERIDLNVCINEKEVEGQIVKACEKLIGAIAPKTGVLNAIKGIFSRFQPELVTGTDGVVKIRLKSLSDNYEDVRENIIEVLISLDEIATKRKAKAVVLFDEFQQLSILEEGVSIEAAIRHSMELSKSLTYLFSGSNRHILAAMFNQEDRPFFRQLIKMDLGRINDADYTAFINKAAKKRWKKALSKDTLKRIVILTERHPYYVNYLCNLLWQESSPPSIKKVESQWNDIIEQMTSWYQSSTQKLTKNQQAFLRALSVQPTNQPQSHEFGERSGIKVASISRTIDSLAHEDLIYKDEEGFIRVIDPGLKHYFSLYKR